MPSQATVTAPLGPGLTVTASVLTDVTRIDYQIAHGTLEITWGVPSRISYFQLNTIATITMTISSGVITATITT